MEAAATVRAPAAPRALRGVLDHSALALLALVLVVFTALNGSRFLNFDNLSDVLLAAAPVGVAAAGLTVVLAMRDFDLSIGAVASISGVVLAQSVEQGWGAWALIPALGVALAIGAANGVMVAYGGMNPFITTLGVAAAVQGLIWTFTDGIVYVASDYPLNWLNDQALGLPIAGLTMLVLVVVLGVVVDQTPLGRRMRAIGGSARGAAQAGIRVRRMRLVGFLASAGCAGLAGVLIVSLQQGGYPTGGDPLLIPAFAAVFLGTVALRRTPDPNHFGTLVGLLLMALVTNGLTIADAAIAVQPVVEGSLLVVALALGGMRRAGS